MLQSEHFNIHIRTFMVHSLNCGGLIIIIIIIFFKFFLIQLNFGVNSMYNSGVNII